MRYELNQNSEIVEYDGDTQFVANTNNTILELFSQGIYTSRITNQDGSVYTLEITNNVTQNTKSILLYYGNIRNESRNPSEKKIQLNGKDPRDSEIPAIILGLYCYQSNDILENLICSAWYVDDTVNYPSNPSIRGINVQMFQEARFNGFIKKDYRNNTVCVFRPEFIFYYLDSINEHHILSANSVISREEQYSSINKIFYGAPGTGKSHKVNEIIKGKEGRTERVTFHPEYDYSSFVGGYKPAMDGDNIKYEFVPQAFTNIYVNAWNDLENDYYLVIEEINRGNCAEIFGDIFQLLDRSNDYKITPSKELKEYLRAKLSGNENIDESKLLLPPNLNILATMNTSDQSLFPMDSAFKRRWDWEYIPINYESSESNSSAKFKVQLTDSEYFSWLAFIESVNTMIKSNDNLGMDKCLGNYFIKPDIDENTISLKSFINKAIFYLWNDVFKDEMEDESIFKNKTSYEDFFPIDEKGVEKVKEILKILKPDNESSEE